MTKNLKRTLSILSAAAILCGATSKQLPGLSGLRDSVSITAEAATVATGTYGSKFSEKCGTDAWLYFSVTDSLGLTAAVTGSSISSANTSVTIPDTVNWMGQTYKVTSIGAEAFQKQTNLCSIYGGINLTEVASKAFKGCSNLEGVSFNYGRAVAKLENIGAYAFSGCKKLLGVPNLKDTKSIGQRAFYGCNALSAIVLESASEIGEGAFGQCYAAQYIDLSKTKLQTIPENAFLNCMAATEIILPDTVTRIDDSAFYGCESFEKIYLPNVTAIGDYAFRYCTKLETVMTNEKLATIGDYAFQTCDSMRYFVCKNPNVKIGAYALGYSFGDKIQDFVIWGKDGTAKTYANAKGFTYHHVKEAATLAKAKQANYFWQVGNSQKAWAVDGTTYNSYGTLEKVHFYADEHKPYINSNSLNAKFLGSCYGMASVGVLTRNGDLTVEQFTKNQFTQISEITTENISEFTKSFVNSCWASYAGSYDYRIDRQTGLMTNKEMLTYIEFITYGADAAVLSYGPSTTSQRHAVVCYGMEFANENTTFGGDFQTNAKILVYDGNSSMLGDTENYLVNTETGEWCRFGRDYDETYCFYDASGKLISNVGTWELTHTTEKMFRNKMNHTGMDAINDLLN